MCSLSNTRKELNCLSDSSLIIDKQWAGRQGGSRGGELSGRALNTSVFDKVLWRRKVLCGPVS